MKKLIFIGPILKGKQAISGGTMKNQLFLQRFSEVFDQVVTVDTFHWQKRPFLFVELLWTLTFNYGAKVVISCEAMAPIIIKFLYYVRLKKEVFYWVIGSGFVERINKGALKPRPFKYLRRIIVQSPAMVESLNRAGVNNAVYIPNSKPIYNIPPVDHSEGKTRFVFLSRIQAEKGCDLIRNCVQRLNSEGLSEEFSVDFYGFKMPGYDFDDAMEGIQNVAYKGILDMKGEEGYKRLSQYDVFLFPTFYAGEGFPGVVIDAYIAGVPLIASDWHFNAEVIADGETGVLIPPQDEESLYSAMKSFVVNKAIINEMSAACKKRAKQYDVNSVLSEAQLKKLNLID